MFKKISILFFALGILSGSKAIGQNIAIQTNLVLNPPYSLSLADYAGAGSDRMTLYIMYTGFNTSTNVQLRFTIQGSGFKLTTRTTYMPPIITLQAGIQEILYGTDLSTYFDPSNLDFTGISKTDYLRTNLLPEGYYTFTVEVFNYPRGNPVSKATASAYIVLNDPPIINTPGNNSKPRANDPQNIVFSWSPRHLGSPNSAFNTEYELKIVEIWPKGRDPYEAMLTSPVLYDATTQNTSLVYDMMCPLLTPGNEYAFNVRAKAMSGIEELDLFKNNGYSETWKFTFGDECKPPANFTAKPVNGGGLEVNWTTGISQTGYNIRYRVKGSDKDWWSDETMTDNIRVYQLPDNTDIEYEVNSGMRHHRKCLFRHTIRSHGSNRTKAVPVQQCSAATGHYRL